MKKKGFTLVEMLVVLVVLALIAAITTPIIVNVVRSTKSNSNKIQKELLISYAKIWLSKNDNKISDVEGSVYNLSLEEMYRDGIISNSTYVDIEKDKSYDNACIKITTKENGYGYEFDENC